ncbi:MULTISPECIES: hypothetical protein [Vitreoscilla]|uniref:Uncharacterized protein n=1 Tax=Vitreoscilla stercoraria TaxID=61 RepID=A0ABY4E7D0_VITST|nr:MULTISPECIES: hypothetical protein [Vitreoscilla]AUZ04631.1 hypothetical protein ADP71_09100 [Vitreoscilla sp. C1]UOO91674.1 hypothetical protein LVJ81_08460 [Vitreoscilla stercoraria]
MLIPYLSIALLGFLANLGCYYAIHRHQIVPVAASAGATLSAIAIASLLPNSWQLLDTTWQAFWLGSSFCGMNNNKWVNMRSVNIIWLIYTILFALSYHYLPLPGGYLGTMALVSSGIWILPFAAAIKK